MAVWENEANIWSEKEILIEFKASDSSSFWSPAAPLPFLLVKYLGPFKAAVTGCHRLGGLWKTEIYFSVWRLEVWNQGTHTIEFWWESSLGGGHRLLSSHCSHIAGRGEGALWGHFYKATNPTHKGTTRAHHCQRRHLLIPSSWRSGFQWVDLERHKHSGHNKD